MVKEHTGLGVMESVFLTHAHIGHYAGLMYLGREVMGTQGVKVYAGEGMNTVLTSGPPWQQLVALGNIELYPLGSGQSVELGPDLLVTPLEVPHRNEYAETFGFIIQGPARRALFIPDIDRWEQAGFSIVELAAQMDYCLIDATFFDGAELPGRNLREIPHPFVTDSMNLLQPVADKRQTQIIFIHLNHSNPLLLPDSPQTHEVLRRGFHIAYEGMEIEL
jgi:pyrroloquinoline quinone biosynthesis protein B